MRFDRISLQGLGPFHNRVDVDLSAIEGRLVAVTGDNGAGKSTFVELLGSILHRVTATRGSLAELATERNAFVEATVVNGATYTIRHLVDAVSGKGESSVTDGAGAAVLTSAKLREFDAWGATHLPSPEVFYSSVFAAQGSGGFLELKAGDRKAVLLRVLGIEHLEKQAELARERARAAKAELQALAARIADERSNGPTVEAAERGLAEATAAAEATDRELAVAQAALDEAETEAAKLLPEVEAAMNNVKRLALLKAQLGLERSRFLEFEARVGNNAKVLEEAAAIRAAVARSPALGTEIDALRDEERKTGSDLSSVSYKLNAWRARLDSLHAQRKRAIVAGAKAAELLAMKPAVDAAQATSQTLRAAIASLEEEETGVRKRIDWLHSEQTGATSARVGHLRSSLERIANGVGDNGDASDVACDAVARDDELVARATSVPEELADLRKALPNIGGALRLNRERLRDQEAIAARAEELSRAELALAQETEESDRLGRELEDLGRERSSLETRQRELEGEKNVVSAALLDLLDERTTLAPLLAKAAPLASAQARLAELTPQRDAAWKRVEALSEEVAVLMDAIGAPVADPSDLVAVHRRRRDAASVTARNAHSAVAVREAHLASARLSEKRLATLMGQQRAMEADLADWTLLADSLGRDGIQALEIDAAGPELTELINDLLRTCVGSRWTVSIETTRASSDGKRMIEGCEVRVIDTERGRDANAETLSGGERVLVGEAISLALSMLACRRTGVEGCTLIRDESGAALDPTNARAYMAMLRRAADILGASHVLFVSHSPEVVDLADAKLLVSNGTVTLVAA